MANGGNNTMNKNAYSLPNPAGQTPPRRCHSIRRTISIDTRWPDTREGPIELQGNARDLATFSSLRKTQILEAADFHLTADSDRYIREISSTTDQATLEQLLNTQAMKPLRMQLDTLFPNLPEQSRLIYQLLHDITGTLIVADWAWASRKESLLPEPRAKRRATMAKMEGACTGFQAGSSSLSTDGSYQASMASPVEPLPRSDDTKSWHPLPESTGVSLRRARRLDVWLDGDIQLESHFQDSATQEQSDQRLSVHEYSVRASFDVRTHVLKSLIATPHILPFPECPGAIRNIQGLLGAHASELKQQVSATLYKTNGCTHLNDVLRSLASAPALIDQLKQVISGQPLTA
jgi:hypothetical protein